MTSLSILKTEAIRSSETSVNSYQTIIQHHTPEYDIPSTKKHVCKVTKYLLKKKTWSLNYTNNTVIFTALIILLIRLLLFLSNYMKTTQQIVRPQKVIILCPYVQCYIKMGNQFIRYREFKNTATLLSIFTQNRSKEDLKNWIYHVHSAVSILRLGANVFSTNVSGQSLQPSNNAQKLITQMDEPSISRRAENCSNQN
jgi:hypothetical protein